MGQLKQLRAHLFATVNRRYLGQGQRSHLPVSLTSDSGAGSFKQAAGTEKAHLLLDYASRTFYVTAFIAIEQVFWRKQREIGAWVVGIKGRFLFLLL
jgi:hypothetical protein